MLAYLLRTACASLRCITIYNHAQRLHISRLLSLAADINDVFGIRSDSEFTVTRHHLLALVIQLCFMHALRFRQLFRPAPFRSFHPSPTALSGHNKVILHHVLLYDCHADTVLSGPKSSSAKVLMTSRRVLCTAEHSGYIPCFVKTVRWAQC